MTKLCPRGKAAAKRKFAVYPSAYANAYASKICAGKIKDPSGVKRKDFKGPKPMKQGDMVEVDKYKSGALTKVKPRQIVELTEERKKTFDSAMPTGAGGADEFITDMPILPGLNAPGTNNPMEIKKGGSIKKENFKYVKGGFEEGDYQDYVLDLIK